MGFVGGYLGSFVGAYLGAVGEVAAVQPIAFDDYVGVVELAAAQRYVGEVQDSTYTGAVIETDYVGALLESDYTGGIDLNGGDEMFEMKVGDRSPSFTATLKNAQTGSAVDLSTATGVTVQFRIGTSGTVKTGTATIVTAASGIVRYDWAAGDLDTAGTCYLEFVATFPSSKTQTFPSGGYYQFPVRETLA